MSQILSRLDGVLFHIDYVLVFGSTLAEHDARLEAALSCLSAAGVTLNAEKCEFRQSNIRFLGHLINRDGIHPDPEKISAILALKAPSSISELRRFLGMVNQLGKFSPNLASLTQPLRELLSAKRAWLWSTEQESSFQELKKELTKPTVLAPYHPQVPTKVSADASSYGLGAVLLQKVGSHWKPVAYASRAMTETERRYAQIEKEALATTWACDKFHNYILGRKFDIETDHKPLVPLLHSKHLDSLPPRILRFRLRLARYDYTIQHVSGKSLYTADTLSRTPALKCTKDAQHLQAEVEHFIESVTSMLPASEQRLQEYHKAQAEDVVCSKVMSYCRSSWPEKSNLEPVLRPFWNARSSLTLHNNLLLYNGHIVVPLSLQKDTPNRVHEGHQGIVHCCMRIKMLVWWPGITSQVTKMM